jgi:hypothetical protein
MLELIIAAVAGGFAHFKVRGWVRNRLRFVDSVQSPLAPILAGVATVAVASPIVWLLPIVGTFTAGVLGVGVGSAVYLGANDVKRLPGA